MMTGLMLTISRASNGNELAHESLVFPIESRKKSEECQLTPFVPINAPCTKKIIFDKQKRVAGNKNWVIHEKES